MVHSSLVLFEPVLVPMVFIGPQQLMEKMTQNVDVGLLMIVWVEGSILTCCCCKGWGSGSGGARARWVHRMCYGVGL